jgi:predicted nucleic acid-binding protein
MIAFFDTNVYVRLMRGDVAHERLARDSVIRLSPIVASELLRGARRGAIRLVEDVVSGLLPVEPPSWRRCWLEAGRLLPRIFPAHEDIGLSRLQNDCMLALTARHTGADFFTYDSHFETIRRHLPFRLATLPA